jgi:hypothetical protein
MKSLGIVQGIPCKKCGKTIRHDYSGVCMDCADDLEISELFERDKDYKWRLERAIKEYKLNLKLK